MVMSLLSAKIAGTFRVSLYIAALIRVTLSFAAKSRRDGKKKTDTQTAVAADGHRGIRQEAAEQQTLHGHPVSCRPCLGLHGPLPKGA